MSYKYISLVSDQEQYVFYKIYKSGSSTISKILRSHTETSSLPYKKVLFKNSIEQLNAYHPNLDLYFKFAFVRNPWDRLVSLYSEKIVNHKKTINKIPYYKEFIGLSFESFLDRIIYSDLESCIPHHRLQTHLMPLNKMNFIGKLENFNKDIQVVLDHLKIKNCKIQRLNQSKHSHYSDCYNNRYKKLVESKYAEDIENFNYSFDKRV